MLEFEEESHTYFWNGEVVPSVNQILQDVGLIDTSFMRGGAERGKAVHLACQILDEGDEVDVAPEIEGYVQAFRKFKTENLYKPILIESKVYHEKLKYAGTLDRTCCLNEIPTILDIKTSQSIQRYVGLQIAAYRLALGQPMRRATLQLKREGEYTIRYFDDDLLDESAWVGAVGMWKWKMTSKKRMKKAA